MPQLDFSIYLSQVFWLFIIFIIFYIIMAKVALPRIGEVIEERRDRIAADLDDAQRLREETNRAIVFYKKALKDANTRADDIIQATKDKISIEILKRNKKLEIKFTKKLEQSINKITATYFEVIKEVDVISTEVTLSLIQLLLNENFDIIKINEFVKSQLHIKRG